jgi:O-antigen ligase
MNFLSRENKDRWHHLAWWLCVISMPWFDALNSACLFFLALITVSDPGFRGRLSNLKDKRWTWPFFVYYLLVVLGLIYTPDFNEGVSTIGQKIAFVIFPLIAVTGRPLQESTIRFLKFSFVYSCFAIVVISLTVGAVNFFSGNGAANFDPTTTANFTALHPDAPVLWMYFSYIQLLRWADLHPAYFSMYLVLSLAILLIEKTNSKNHAILHFTIGTLIAGFVAMLASRASIIALILSMVFLIVRKRDLPVLQIATAVVVVVLALWFNPVARFRVVEEPLTTTYKADSSVTQWNSVSYRLLEWQGSLSIISSHFLFGVGTSGWKSAMHNFYANFNSSTIGVTYNSHNQFLQTWMENGFFALVALAFCIFGPLFQFKADPTHIAFILIFSIMCMTESILDRQKGIIFFTLFQSMFLASKELSQ